MDADARLEDERREGRVAVRAGTADNLLPYASRVHHGAVREVEDLEDRVAALIAEGEISVT